MMSRRTKIIILLVLLLLALLLGGFFLWRLFRPTVEPVPVVDTTPEPNEPARTPTRTNTAPVVTGEDRSTTFTVQSLAKTFTERFGSYSTEANFENLKDVMPLMSAKYAAETNAFLATAVAPSEYYGVTTRIVAIKVLSSDETTAVLEVSTQREEAKGSVQNVSVRYQTLSLSLIQEDGTWKVDAATWK